MQGYCLPKENSPDWQRVHDVEFPPRCFDVPTGHG